ncbi:PA2779 family protein [Persephonella atlantica]|uniref:PA2779 family protein n=1 Tax=Persephonella atlantica TaxID=2699429 RepID=A0ABS1GGE3_9AQUI|nr:PA2779 family protein [Persephonella atlantica]MBK3331955.1 PA2779 family protein [Persephonella atlantica]
MLKKVSHPFVVLSMAFYFLFLHTAPAVAGMVDSITSEGESAQSLREMEINKIQRALENELVREKLQAYGLTPQEVNEKLSQMSDQQIHMLAQASDKVLAGGDLLGTVIAVLIIVLLIVLILKLLGKEIIIA